VRGSRGRRIGEVVRRVMKRDYYYIGGFVFVSVGSRVCLDCKREVEVVFDFFN
jgi:hypothetical protein